LKHATLIPLAAALVGGCTADADDDGHDAEADCNDENAAIYPGATETIGDGIDSDCDGEDPPYAFIGDWTLKTITATMDGYEEDYDVLEYWNETGEISIGDDLKATHTLVLAYEDETEEEGYTFSHSGTATVGSDPAAFELKGSGTGKYDGDTYESDVDWDCVVAGTKITCEGDLSWTDSFGDSYSIDCDAEFEAKAD